ncbi:1,3-beta-glucanosyltransferase gas1 [Aspergillus nanangensis]|uniref:1,3-beta-glucanosyltransferase n=1 Tax=Aspergillus nanangensis TaxID=2582783 RepID=A0AAD4GSD4_ASPNN|nr:1,3-beta-glucanosyltransferase gas1 [Aspergillus nanangensis]
MKLSSIVATATLFASNVLAAELDPIIIKGSKFFYKSNETQFFMRGVAYQQEEFSGPKSSSDNYKDPLADAEACKRDVPYLQKLNANLIRVYAIDPDADHKACMDLLTDAGIYIVADLSSPGTSIIRNDPKWNADLYKRYTSVVDEMAKYTNTLGFFAGNEVSNTKKTTDASAFVKAAVRDMKRYIKAKDYRPMGVGYATNDDSDIRKQMSAYFNCNEEEESIDFWGYNVYSWCGDSNYEKSGFKSRTEEFRDYSVPVFFAEYGCNEVEPRKFTEVSTLYGDKMAEVWSGGIVYMYHQEDNNYGLVSVGDGKVKTRADYSYLSKQLAKATPTGVKKSEYKPSNSALASCPPVNGNWLATPSPLPPSPNQQLCDCMEESITCKLKDNVSGKKLDKLFGTVCGFDGICDGITTNATTGKYGAYSVCSPEQQLSFAMDLYYQEQEKEGNGADACDFDGAASTQKSGNSDGSCDSLLKAAGTSGTGSVQASPTDASGGAAGASASGSEGAAFMVAPGSVQVGYLQLGAYVVTAVVAGASMILLLCSQRYIVVEAEDMARLNIDSPLKAPNTTQKKPKTFRKLGLKTPLQRRFRDFDASPNSPSDEKDDQWADTRSTVRAPRGTDMLSQVKSRSQKMGMATGGIFDIFSDSDGLSDKEHEQRKPASRAPSGTLKLAPVNSMLLPQAQQPQSRRPQKPEPFVYDKENDPIEHQQDDDEYQSSISRNPSDASSRRSTARRGERQEPVKNEKNELFMRYRQQEVQPEDEDSDENSLDSMDDFIVSDKEESFHETSDDEFVEEQTIKKPSPPKQKKRLVRGRRPSPEEELKKALQQPQKGEFTLEPSLPLGIAQLSPEKPRKLFQERNKPEIAEKMRRLSLDSDDPSSQLQQDLFDAITRFEPVFDKTEIEGFTLETPPSSPRNSNLQSPKRRNFHIPPTPHRESSDAFWSQEVTDAWVDQHSPLKLDKVLQDFEDSEDEVDTDFMPRLRETKKGPKALSKTAIKKAEIEQRKAALARKKSFDTKKASVAEDFFKVLDDAVSGGKIQKLAEETGGIRITWSKTLQTTAGRASWKREKQLKPGVEAPLSSKHHATIELAERIIDSEDRLLNTLAHEYCHLANFMISNVHNNPHGTSFKAWGLKCKEALKDHPVYGGRVEVSTKHSYKIDFKYVWCCVDCGQNYGRHSKSIDTTKSRCGKCQGLLQQIKPKPRSVSPRKRSPVQPQGAFDDVVNDLGAVTLA